MAEVVQLIVKMGETEVTLDMGEAEDLYIALAKMFEKHVITQPSYPIYPYYRGPFWYGSGSGSTYTISSVGRHHE